MANPLLISIIYLNFKAAIFKTEASWWMSRFINVSFRKCLRRVVNTIKIKLVFMKCFMSFELSAAITSPHCPSPPLQSTSLEFCPINRLLKHTSSLCSCRHTLQIVLLPSFIFSRGHWWTDIRFCPLNSTRNFPHDSIFTPSLTSCPFSSTILASPRWGILRRSRVRWTRKRHFPCS